MLRFVGDGDQKKIHQKSIPRQTRNKYSQNSSGEQAKKDWSDKFRADSLLTARWYASTWNCKIGAFTFNVIESMRLCETTVAHWSLLRQD